MLMLSAGFLKDLTERDPSSLSVVTYLTSLAPKYNKERLGCCLSRAHTCPALWKNFHWDSAGDWVVAAAAAAAVVGITVFLLSLRCRPEIWKLPTLPPWEPAISPQLQWLLSQSLWAPVQAVAPVSSPSINRQQSHTVQDFI